MECLWCHYTWPVRLDYFVDNNKKKPNKMRCPVENTIHHCLNRSPKSLKRFKVLYKSMNKQIKITNLQGIYQQYFEYFFIYVWNDMHHQKNNTDIKNYVEVEYDCRRHRAHSHQHCVLAHLIKRQLNAKRHNRKPLFCGICSSKQKEHRDLVHGFNRFKTWYHRHKKEVKIFHLNEVKYCYFNGQIDRKGNHVIGHNIRVQCACLRSNCHYGDFRYKHHKHDNWTTTINVLTSNRPNEKHHYICPRCCGTGPLNPDIFESKVHNNFKNTIFINYDYELPDHSSTIVHCICRKCNSPWKSQVIRLENSQGCPYCSRKVSINELYTRRYFRNWEIHECESKEELNKCKVGFMHSFSVPPKNHKLTDTDYDHNKDLSIDFMFKCNNIYYPIELDGLQHAKPVIFGKTKGKSQAEVNQMKKDANHKFYIQKKHDKHKTRWIGIQRNRKHHSKPYSSIIRVKCYKKFKEDHEWKYKAIHNKKKIKKIIYNKLDKKLRNTIENNVKATRKTFLTNESGINENIEHTPITTRDGVAYKLL